MVHEIRIEHAVDEHLACVSDIFDLQLVDFSLLPDGRRCKVDELLLELLGCLVGDMLVCDDGAGHRTAVDDVCVVGIVSCLAEAEGDACVSVFQRVP